MDDLRQPGPTRGSWDLDPDEMAQAMASRVDYTKLFALHDYAVGELRDLVAARISLEAVGEFADA